jgi:hypothetical protein
LGRDRGGRVCGGGLFQNFTPPDRAALVNLYQVVIGWMTEFLLISKWSVVGVVAMEGDWGEFGERVERLLAEIYHRWLSLRWSLRAGLVGWERYRVTLQRAN